MTPLQEKTLNEVIKLLVTTGCFAYLFVIVYFLFNGPHATTEIKVVSKEYMDCVKNHVILDSDVETCEQFLTESKEDNEG